MFGFWRTAPQDISAHHVEVCLVNRSFPLTGECVQAPCILVTELSKLMRQHDRKTKRMWTESYHSWKNTM